MNAESLARAASLGVGVLCWNNACKWGEKGGAVELLRGPQQIPELVYVLGVGNNSLPIPQLRASLLSILHVYGGSSPACILVEFSNQNGNCFYPFVDRLIFQIAKGARATPNEFYV